MAKIVRCKLKQGEFTTIRLADGTFTKAKGGELYEVADDYDNPLFEEYTPPK